jgi:hypothetical protein
MAASRIGLLFAVAPVTAAEFELADDPELEHAATPTSTSIAAAHKGTRSRREVLDIS